MANKPKLSPKQVDEMMELFSDGYTATKIQVYVKEKYNIDITLQSIARYVRRIKQTRKEITDLVYKEAVSKSAVRDIDIIDKKIKQLDQISDELLKKKEYKFAKEFQEVLLKYVSKKIDMNDGKPEDDNDLLDNFLDKINNR